MKTGPFAVLLGFALVAVTSAAEETRTLLSARSGVDDEDTDDFLRGRQLKMKNKGPKWCALATGSAKKCVGKTCDFDEATRACTPVECTDIAKKKSCKGHCGWDGGECEDVECEDLKRKQCTMEKTNGSCYWAPASLAVGADGEKWDAGEWGCRYADFEPTCTDGRTRLNIDWDEDEVDSLITVQPCFTLRFQFNPDSSPLWQFTSSGCYKKCKIPSPKHIQLADGNGGAFDYPVRFKDIGDKLMFADEDGCDDDLKMKVKVGKIKYNN